MEPHNTNRLQFLHDDVNVTSKAERKETTTIDPPSLIKLPSQQQAQAEQLPLPPTAALDEAHIQSLFAVMRREQRRERAYHRYQNFFLTFAVAVLLYSTYIHNGDVCKWVTVGNIINILLRKISNSQASKRAIKELAELEDIRVVGPLADTLGFRVQDLKPQVEKALAALLPRLQATDSAMLTTQQRNNLRQAVLGDNSELVIAILKAYEQIGDSHDLAAVKRLANGASMIAAVDRVHAAALECLPYLQANVERERAATTLLRASDAVSATPDTLLRPAEGAPTTATEQLLRIPYNDDDRVREQANEAEKS